MMDAQTRLRPAGTGREVESTALRTAREAYHGSARPIVALASRDAFTIASELAAAADTLSDLSERFASGAFTGRDLSSVDALLIGCARLVGELRQRQDGAP